MISFGDEETNDEKYLRCETRLTRRRRGGLPEKGGVAKRTNERQEGTSGRTKTVLVSYLRYREQEDTLRLESNTCNGMTLLKHPQSQVRMEDNQRRMGQIVNKKHISSVDYLHTYVLTGRPLSEFRVLSRTRNQLPCTTKSRERNRGPYWNRRENDGYGEVKVAQILDD